MARFQVSPATGDAPLDPTALAGAMRSADALVPSVSDRITAELLAVEGRRVRLIANFGAGTDNIDVSAARRLGIVVTNTPGVLTEDTADLAIYLMLATLRQTGRAERELRAGAWTGWRPTHVFGEAVRGKTLGIVGFGRIGRAVAERATAFGMRVCYVTRTWHSDGELLAERMPSLDALLEASDVVSLHTPATSETHHLMDARRLSRMKPTAILLNTARGSLVDEQALVDALSSGRLRAAGLDVFEHEPRVSPALLALDNVVALPHIGSATRETRDAMGMMVVANLVAFFDGSPIPNRVV